MNMADDRATMDVKEQASVETTDRGLFDFMKKKDGDEKPQEEKVASEFDHKLHVSQPDVTPVVHHDEKEKHHAAGAGLLQKLHRSDSSSSSSSDEEGDDEEKKKRKKEKKDKKGLKDKMKQKLGGHKDEEDTNVPIEKYEETKPHVHAVVYSEPSHPPAPPTHQVDDHEKKGFMDKIKDKLPGKKPDEHHHDSAAPVTPVAAESGAEGEKKGFLEKIKEKIPGFHSKDTEEKKESH